MQDRIPQPAGERVLVEIGSSSRPGLVHEVRIGQLAGEDSCDCERFVYTREVYRHIRQARIRLAKASRTRTCRSCGGFGYFGWGEMAPRNCPTCPDCSGAGKVAA